MKNKTYIYGLVCPLDGKLKYVGKSDYPEERLKQHVNEVKKSLGEYLLSDKPEWYAFSRKKLWLITLWGYGITPQLKILEKCNFDEWRERELYWIEKSMSEGFDLMNKVHKNKGSFHNPNLRVISGRGGYMSWSVGFRKKLLQK